MNPDGAVSPPVVEEIGWFDVTDPGTAGMARRAAAEAARTGGLTESRGGEVAIAAAELASNLYKHATGGRMAVRRLRCAGGVGVELIALDSGPGMSDLDRSALDGHSTSGTLGIGLGAVERLASRYDGYSLPGRGTVIMARFLPAGSADHGPDASGVTRPISGEEVCGDRFAMRYCRDHSLIMVVDGLGHGPLAAAAAAAAVDAFRETGETEPGGIIEVIHRATARTRGAAVAVARIEPTTGSEPAKGSDPATGTVRFAGLGNIAATIVTAPGAVPGRTGPPGRLGMVSLPGIAGHQRRTVREFTYPVGAGDLVVLHSDGVTTRWDLSAYPGIGGHEPLVIAATLLRDAGVRRDDACVLVARVPPG